MAGYCFLVIKSNLEITLFQNTLVSYINNNPEDVSLVRVLLDANGKETDNNLVVVKEAYVSILKKHYEVSDCQLPQIPQSLILEIKIPVTVFLSLSMIQIKFLHISNELNKFLNISLDQIKIEYPGSSRINNKIGSGIRLIFSSMVSEEQRKKTSLLLNNTMWPLSDHESIKSSWKNSEPVNTTVSLPLVVRPKYQKSNGEGDQCTQPVITNSNNDKPISWIEVVKKNMEVRGESSGNESINDDIESPRYKVENVYNLEPLQVYIK